MRRVLWMILALVLAVPSLARADMPAKPIELPKLEFGTKDGADIRNFVWGIKPDDVRSFEQATFFDQVDQEGGHSTVFYLDHVLGYRTLLAYRFYKDRLWQVRFDLQNTSFDSEAVLKDFMKAQIDLDQKFGPSKLEMTWRNNLYKETPGQWGYAVKRGDLDIAAVWDKDDTSVRMTLSAKAAVFQWQVTATGKTLKAEIDHDRAGGPAVILPETTRPLPGP